MRISLKKPVVITVLAFVAWMLVVGTFSPNFSKLTSVQENNNSDFLPKDAEATAAQAELEKFSDGNQSFPTLILFEGTATPEAVGAVNAYLITAKDHTLGDTSAKIGDYLLEGAPLVATPAPDGKAILVAIPMNTESIAEVLPNEEPVLPAIIETLREEIKPVAASINATPYVTGPGGIFGDLFSAFSAIDSTLLLTTVVVVGLILIFVYRSPILWYLPLLTAFYALSVAGGIIYVLAKNDVIDVDGQSQGILSILVIGAATDYALLLIARYREELHHHERPFDAMKTAFKGIWEPIVASGSTVAISLLLLLFSQLTNTAGLGPVGAIGVVCAMISVLVLLPVFLLVPSMVLIWSPLFIASAGSLYAVSTGEMSIGVKIGTLVFIGLLDAFVITLGIKRYKNRKHNRATKRALLDSSRVQSGRWIFWPMVPSNDGDDHVLSGPWSKVAKKIEERPRRAWVTTGVVLLLLAFASTTLKADGLGTLDTFTGRPESVVGQEKLLTHFPGGEGDPTRIVIPFESIDEVTAAVTKVPGVVTAVPLTDGYPSAVNPTPPTKIVDGLVVLDVTLDKAPDSVDAARYIPAIRDAVHAVEPTALVGGTSAVYHDIREANDQDNRTIIPIVLLVITLILAVLLRSIYSAIVLLGTVVLSYFATLGACALVFNHAYQFPGGDNSFPLFAFVFLVALGIDYNIFLMTRVREESIKLGTRAGVTKGVTVTGSVITSAGVVLAATFAVLTTLPLVPLKELGFAVAFGVLLDTIIVRSILVPAMTHEIGKKIWWPSKLAKGND